MADENRIHIEITGDPSGAVAATGQVTRATGDLSEGTRSMASRIKEHWLGVSAAILAVYASLRGAISFAKESIEAAASQELAERKLAAALGHTSQALIDQASAMQQLTRYEDDAVIEAQALIAMFVKDESQIKKATQATLDLAAAKGMDLRNAADLVAKTLCSSTNALSRYGIEVTGAVGSTERLESTVSNISRVFGGQAVAAAETYSGRVIQLKNAWGDMKEELGKAITQNRFLIETTGILKSGIEDLTKWVQQNKAALMEMVRDAVLWAVDAFVLLVGVIDKAAAAWRHVKASSVAGAEAILASQGDLSAAMGEATKEVLAQNKVKDESWKALIARLEQMRAKIAQVRAGEKTPAAIGGGGKGVPEAGPTDVQRKVLDDARKQMEAQARMAEEMEARVTQARELSRIAQERAAIASLRKELDFRVKIGVVTASQAIERKYEMDARELQLKREELLTRAVNANEAQRVELSAEYARIGEEIVRLEEYRTYEVAARRLEIEREIRDITREQNALLFESRMAQTETALGAIGGSELASNVGMLSALQEGQDPYQQDYDRWAQLQDQKIMRLQELGATEAELKDYYREYDLRMEETQQQQKIAMASNTFGMMAGVASAFYAASGDQNKAAFRVMQAMRIGETVMNTYSAAVGAYNALAGIPIVGPALGAAAAAAAIAFGMAQVKAISAMKPGGGAVGSARASAPAIPALSGREPEISGGEKEGQGPSRVVNVHVYGNIVDHDAFARELVPAILKAQDDGVRG